MSDNWYNCYHCEMEFLIESARVNTLQVTYCPFCSSDLDLEDEELEDEDG